MKLFIVEVHAFGKHVTERVEAESREAAQAKVEVKYGILITSQPA